jgi:hypothetical protein
MFRVVTLEVDGPRVSLAVDGATQWKGQGPGRPIALELRTENTVAIFEAFELTLGWEDLFLEPTPLPESLGWAPSPEGHWIVANGVLEQPDEANEHATITKSIPLRSYEFVVNARSLTSRDGAAYGFFPAITLVGEGPRFVVEADETGWSLVATDGTQRRHFPLGADFDPYIFQQFRFRKQGGTLTVFREGKTLGVLHVSEVDSYVGLYVRTCHAAFDAVRVVALPEESV